MHSEDFRSTNNGEEAHCGLAVVWLELAASRPTDFWAISHENRHSARARRSH